MSPKSFLVCGDWTVREACWNLNSVLLQRLKLHGCHGAEEKKEKNKIKNMAAAGLAM